MNTSPVNEISVVSPTRVDFAGGTLDCWPLFNLVGDARTINLSIDILTGATLISRDDQQVLVRGHLDEEYTKFSNVDQFLQSSDSKWALLQGHVEYWKPQQGFAIHYTSQSPVGAGLGGSSSLSISLIKAFSKWCEVPMTELEMVTLAHNVEARLLHTPTGTQDYFPAITSGLHSLHYTAKGVEHEVFECDLSQLQSRFFLVYTGKPHHSGLNNWSVIKKAVDKDKSTLHELAALKEVAESVYQVCREQDWSSLADLFLDEYKHRVALAPAFSSPEIDKLNTICLEGGASAVKICGAGGGGCVMVWSDPDKRDSLMKLCLENNFEVFAVAPVKREP
ncbi:MAG: galactokinase [Bdellovibrionales bacterium]|nr:galactokinase [Bdellovibrionales bacterium]